MKRLVLCYVVFWTMSASAQDETADFLRKHWAFPVPPQGMAPPSYTPLEASLNPEACGSCHPVQYEGWKKSRHAHAMGPGVVGQLLDIDPDALAELRACTRCHTPLAEQEASLGQQLRGIREKGALHERGLVCAGCHVRRNVRYGPPPRQVRGYKAHGGFVNSPAFEDGRFCATCHQFGKDGYALNGKPLENTYAEWKASPYAKRRLQCQGCHMPDRRHAWRGIHDRQMSARGVTIGLVEPVGRKNLVHAQLAMTNSGTGHDFPTYVTPRILMQIYQETADGKSVAGSLRQRIVGRQVSQDLSEELADTRLAPGERVILDYDVPRYGEAAAVVVRVRVEPDYFYAELYRYLLESDGKGKPLIRAALSDALGSAYDLFSRSYSLK